MMPRLELQTIHRQQSVFTITKKAPSSRGLHRDYEKTDCENRWIVCSTTINARLLSVSLVNGNGLISEAYFCLVIILESFNILFPVPAWGTACTAEDVKS